MKSFKVPLFRFPAFTFFSFYKKKIERVMVLDLEADLKYFNTNTSKNSTFTLEPNVLQLVIPKGKQVLGSVKFEVCFEDSSPLTTVFPPSHKTVVIN
ncbi:hypothetical protein LDL77_13865 [Flagellimonas marinaquae]|uniref:hypothetical protein n=1 Tax=Flagellimonas aurea TaxID=2915619 RepID=UPI001CE1A242|nr:hypothetical protein LDL77_13865 [Allomuricauda aquimarina]